AVAAATAGVHRCWLARLMPRSRRRARSARLVVIVPLAIPGLVSLAMPVVVVVIVRLVRMSIAVISAQTGRGGGHSTTGLTVIAAARLMVAHLDQGVGHGHPQLNGERGVVACPVGDHGRRPRAPPMFVIWLWHSANVKRAARFGPRRPGQLTPC